MLVEQMRYNLLFRWFVGLAIEDPVWDHSVFSKNRDRLLAHEVVEAFFTGQLVFGHLFNGFKRSRKSAEPRFIQISTPWPRRTARAFVGQRHIEGVVSVLAAGARLPLTKAPDHKT
jgi:hypothetical protein